MKLFHRHKTIADKTRRALESLISWGSDALPHSSTQTISRRCSSLSEDAFPPCCSSDDVSSGMTPLRSGLPWWQALSPHLSQATLTPPANGTSSSPAAVQRAAHSSRAIKRSWLKPVLVHLQLFPQAKQERELWLEKQQQWHAHRWNIVSQLSSLLCWWGDADCNALDTVSSTAGFRFC